MTIAAAETTLTGEEFLALPDAHDYELIDGHLVERGPMGAESDYVALQIATFLNLYRRERREGWVLSSETTYRCFGSPRTFRRADVSYIRPGRLPGETVPK